MAHALYKPEAGNTVESPDGERQFYHAASGTYYSLTAHDGRYYQRCWQQGFDGNPENVEELPIDYVMGSGNHARTYLHREEDGTLIELPMAAANNPYSPAISFNDQDHMPLVQQWNLGIERQLPLALTLEVPRLPWVR